MNRTGAQVQYKSLWWAPGYPFRPRLSSDPSLKRLYQVRNRAIMSLGMQHITDMYDHDGLCIRRRTA